MTRFFIFLIVTNMCIAPVLAQPTTTASATPRAQIDDTAKNPHNDLRQAYKREFAFLEEQKRDLQQRLQRFAQSAHHEQDKQQIYIRGLSSSLLDLDTSLQAVQKQIGDAQGMAEKISEQQELLDGVLNQAHATLFAYGDSEPAPEHTSSAQQLNWLLQHSDQLVQRLSDLRTESGSFYLRDGTRVAGQITLLGNIAAYGASERGAGTLAPAGGGEMKIWKDADPGVARAFVSGLPPREMDLFAFESRANAIEGKVVKTVLGTIRDGGSIAWAITALGLCGLVLVILRGVFLLQAGANTAKHTARVGDSLHRGDIDNALKQCRSNNAICRVIRTTLTNLDREREHLEDIISEAILHETAHLNRFGSAIIVIAAVSPLLGLLGTVTGMISTFDVITEFGTGDPKLLSGGISIALITTEIGLMVAIPALLLGNLLSGWAESIKSGMEHAALRIMNQYQDHLFRQAAILEPALISVNAGTGQ